jgi:hypothetical protein
VTKVLAADQIKLKLVDLLNGTVSPAAGGGVAAAIGSFYLQGPGGTGRAWLKLGAANTAWNTLGNPLEWYVVTEYGAIGNGVADDTAAIQDAIDACALAGGGVVYFPGPHTYNVTQLTISAQDNVQLLGAGTSSVIKWVWDAATVAGSMITITAGSDRCKISDLQLDGSGLTNPNAGRANHLLLIDGAGGGVVDTRVARCKLTGMVAASGDGVHVVGTAANLVSRLWITGNELDGCSRFGVGHEQGWEYGWITDNYFTNCETDIGLVSTADLNSTNLLVMGNEIVHTGAVRHAIRIEGAATLLYTKVIVSKNTIIGGFARLQFAQWMDNVQTSGAFASADAVLRVFDAFSDCLILGNLNNRAAGADAGPSITVEKSAGAPTRFRIGNNMLLNEPASPPAIIKVVDGTNFSIGGNSCVASDAGANVNFGIDIQAVTVVLTGPLIGPGNNVLAIANNFKAGARILANGANVTNFSIVGNGFANTDYGAQFEIGGGGGAFSGVQMFADNNINVNTDQFLAVGAPALSLRIGANAGSTLTNSIFVGTGTPESVVSARIGSLFMRTDGGNGTALYYKETGTGTTGWVALGGAPIVFGTGDTTANAAAQFLAPGYIATSTTTEYQLAITRPGTIRNLRVKPAVVGVGAANNTYTVRKNGVDTTLTVTSSNTTTTLQTDAVNSFTVVAGDLLSLSVVKSAGVVSGQLDVVASMEVA